MRQTLKEQFNQLGISDSMLKIPGVTGAFQLKEGKLIVLSIIPPKLTDILSSLDVVISEEWFTEACKQIEADPR